MGIRKLLGLNRDRDWRDELLRTLPSEAVCAEVGVWKGEFSRQILQASRPKRLHLIDPWAFQPEFPERMYGGSVAKEQQDMDRIHAGVVQAFEAQDSVQIHRGTSEAVLPTFEDAYFDWVYIDGNHYYEYVKQDLELSSPKVKPGGYLAGDDFSWGVELGYPVKKAAEEFQQAHRNAYEDLVVLGSQFLMRKKANG